VTQTEVAPYLRLWASVMLQAKLDIWDKEAVIRDSARCWLTDERDHPGSIRWLCTLFDLDEIRTRNQMRLREGITVLRARVVRSNRTRAAAIQAAKPPGSEPVRRPKVSTR
jgi:hypothetical protein